MRNVEAPDVCVAGGPPENLEALDRGVLEKMAF